MTIARTLLAKGYFPKELPPAFSSSAFADYASTQQGRQTLETHLARPATTNSIVVALALPSREHRILAIPHPTPFTKLVREVAKAFSRLLTKGSKSRFSKSRPLYTPKATRAIQPRSSLNAVQEARVLARTGARVLLRTDISHFYPSLYTHAVGWAIDSGLRKRSNWNKTRFLGKRIDQQLMNCNGKISQGIPIGPDVSMLLAEIVLGQVDRELRHYAPRAFRWYDDYEMAFDTTQEAESALAAIRRALAKFNLRLNPKKTSILPLPLPSHDSWTHQVDEAAAGLTISPSGMVRFFDRALEMKERHADAPVLAFAIGKLFGIAKPDPKTLRVAESLLIQSMLSEPGSAQRCFALLTFWNMNGATFSATVWASAVERLVCENESARTSTDVGWALAFAISHTLPLSGASGKALSGFEDDCTIIQTLHAHQIGLLKSGFASKRFLGILRESTLDGPHWMALYESVRNGYLPKLRPVVMADTLFNDMLARDVAFYREAMPSFAMFVHAGGAPASMVRKWLAPAPHAKSRVKGTALPLKTPVTQALEEAVAAAADKTADEPDTVTRILGLVQHADDDEGFWDPYVA